MRFVVNLVRNESFRNPCASAAALRYFRYFALKHRPTTESIHASYHRSRSPHTGTHTHTRRLAHTESVHAFCCLIRRHYQDRMKLALAAVVAGAIISTHPTPWHCHAPSSYSYSKRHALRSASWLGSFSISGHGLCVNPT